MVGGLQRLLTSATMTRHMEGIALPVRTELPDVQARWYQSKL